MDFRAFPDFSRCFRGILGDLKCIPGGFRGVIGISGEFHGFYKYFTGFQKRWMGFKADVSERFRGVAGVFKRFQDDMTGE